MKIVIALGGNALGKTPEEQLELVKETAKQIVKIVEEGHYAVRQRIHVYAKYTH